MQQEPRDADVVVRALLPGADEGLARELLALQRAAYALEAELIGDDRIPPLSEDLEALRTAPLTWAGAFVDGRLGGAVAWAEDDDLLDIHRLVVAPAVSRRGLGSALVRHALARAGTRTTVVSTGADNHPARALYERLGFSADGEREVLPGLRIRRYRHQPAPSDRRSTSRGSGGSHLGAPVVDDR